MNFDKYINLIRKSAHFYSKKYNIEYDDVEAEGFKIYIESLETFNPEKSSFVTYLTWELKRLNYYCKKECNRRINTVTIDDKVFENVAFDENGVVFEKILESAKSAMSDVAYRILNWILGRDWERKNVLKPTINLATKEFKLPRKKIIPYWKEIGDFWKNAREYYGIES